MGATGFENIWQFSVQDEAKTLLKQEMKCCQFLDFVRGTAWVAFKLAIFGMAKGHVARRLPLPCSCLAKEQTSIECRVHTVSTLGEIWNWQDLAHIF